MPQAPAKTPLTPTTRLPRVASLERSGLVRREDLRDPEYRALVGQLDGLDTGGGTLLSDGLRHWSRRWEYPYAIHGLYHYLSSLGRPGRALDVACGYTDVPFVLTAVGHSVVGSDLDPALPPLWEARRAAPTVAGRAEYRPGDAEKLPFADGEFDAAYCVSALEHMNDPAAAAREMCRVVRPGGLVLITCDMEPQGIGLPYAKFSAMLAALDAATDFHHPPRWCHPAEALTFGTREDDSRGAVRRTLAALTYPLRGGGRPPTDLAIYATARLRKAT
jgi:SAM-dependent methyltransferase